MITAWPGESGSDVSEWVPMKQTAAFCGGARISQIRITFDMPLARCKGRMERMSLSHNILKLSSGVVVWMKLLLRHVTTVDLLIMHKYYNM
jgi:hypothetical protein